MIPAGERRLGLWRNRDYMLLWSGQVVSSLGSTVSAIVMPLFILVLTGSPWLAGIAGALNTLPYLVFSLPVGALIDRWDRKLVMVLCDAGRAINMFSVPVAMLFDALTVWQLYAVTLVEGTLFVFFNIAEVAALPRVVRKDQLGDATSQNMATHAAANLVGPAIGGYLFQVVGRGVPFLLDGISYMLSALSLLAIKTRFQGEKAAVERGTRRIGAEIKEGLAWAWNEPLVRFTSFLSGGMNVVFSGGFLIIIVLAQNLGAGEAAIGTIFSIGSVGGIVGAALGGRINRRFTLRQIVLATVWINVVCFPLYALAPSVLALGLIAAVVFISVPVYSVAALSYRLALIPDALQGRVNSAVRLVAFGFQPVGSALAGFLLERVGAVPAVAVFSGLLLVMGLLSLAMPLRPPDALPVSAS
ncbi:MAG TPA: MFS transporter [Chloroflexia bacterium]|nr:MFS transporter [Chloroflexia bacterium]